MELGLPTPQTVRDKVVSLFNQGGPVRTVAAAAGCSKPTAYKILRAVGLIPLPSRSCTRSTADDRRVMVEAYVAGMTAQDAAALRGFRGPVCAAAVRAAGLPLRTQSEISRVYGRDDNYFADVSTPEQAWALGFISADGCISGPSLAVGVARRDREVLETLRRLLRYTGPIRDYDSVRTGKHPRLEEKSVLAVRSERLTADLTRLGVTPRKSLTLLPWDAPPALAAHYFRGLVDGDGHLGCSVSPAGRNQWTVTLIGARPVVEAFSRFVTIHTGSRSTPLPNGSIFQVGYNGIALPQRVAALLYGGSPVSLARKQAVAEEMMALAPSQRWWGHVSAETLLSLHSLHRSWKAVARTLGVDPCWLRKLRKRRGLL